MKNIIEDLIEIFNLRNVDMLVLAQKAIVSALIIIIGTVFSRAARKLVKKASSGKININEDIGMLFQHIIRYGIFIICVIMILNIFGVNTASLIAVLGAAGVAIGLALKDTLGNIASGIIILILGNYRKGEYIEFGGFSGTVKEVNLFTTILETPDGIYVSAPNSSIWGTPLKNYTRNGRRRMELVVNISYSDSLDTAFQVLRDIIRNETGFLKDPEPQVILQNLNDSSVAIAIRAWAQNQDYWNIYWRQIRNIKEKIEGAGLHIPYPQRDIRIVAEGSG
jgi:small conductance mechanosensitive channel